MYRVLACLTEQHDYRLVALAAFICVAASFTAFWLYQSALTRTGGRRHALLLLTGSTTAVGIWTTHFVGMLAFDAGMPVSYEMTLTVASLLIAVIGTTAGFAIMANGSRAMTVLGGMVTGLGISGMHFTGMKSVIVGGQLSWDRETVAVAIISGVVLSAAAATAHQLLGRRFKRAAPLLLVLAICSMHFIGMGAATFTFDPAGTEAFAPLDRLSLVFIVAAVTMLVLIACILTSIIERFTISRGMLGFGGAVIAALLTITGIGAYAFDQLKIGGDNYNRIVGGKELLADLLPPPLLIIEAYQEADFAVDEPERVAQHKHQLAKLKQAYLNRREHWRSSSDIPTPIRIALTETANIPVKLFWREAETVLLPAIERGDQELAAASMKKLRSYFFQQREIIDNVVLTTQTHVTQVETSAQTRGGLLGKLMIGALLILFGIIVASIQTLRLLVIKPVLITAGYLENLSKGNYSALAPYAERTDEIGTMAKAIETLRLASVEKQRLEAEAVETRRIYDQAKARREREKASEAMRINLANENITALNSDLNAAISQLQRAQDDNLRKGRLAQLGQLTATVAHEIRNPLGAIKTAAYLVDRKTKDKDLGIEPPMQRIRNGIQRCDNIITELLDFTRVKALTLTAQPTDDWVNALIDEEGRTLPADIAIVRKMDAGGEAVQFDTSRMRRVLINLLSNAAEAMVGKGNEPGASKIVNPTITVSTRVANGIIEIGVSDNGPGISEENLAKIREPLFTTKSFGVGLGLPAVENILEQHGGGLRIASEIGKGATITAWFPVRKVELDLTDTSAASIAA
jgi:NO-binding membrane sensor protein with MHYT domain/signal transduction histidine kinase